MSLEIINLALFIYVPLPTSEITIKLQYLINVSLYEYFPHMLQRRLEGC